MHFHRGRLVDHVHLRVADLPVSKRFYRAVLESLGRAQGIREGDDFFNSDELWIDQADVLEPATGSQCIRERAAERAGSENGDEGHGRGAWHEPRDLGSVRA